jgi:AcrR family transcriptional regulator
VAHISASRRANAKLQTRRRLIDAAKQLAGERGYEAATLRDVAALAGLSTGAVFANFVDKADLFSAAIAADDEALLAVMHRAADLGGAPRRTLLAMLAAAQAMQQQELAWVRVKMSLLWSCAGRQAPRHAAHRGGPGRRPARGPAARRPVGERRSRSAGGHGVGSLPLQLPPRGVRRLERRAAASAPGGWRRRPVGWL